MAKRSISAIAGAAAVAVLIAWLPASMITAGLAFVFDLNDDRSFNGLVFFVFYLTAAFCGSLTASIGPD